jgi:hypothetical protein
MATIARTQATATEPSTPTDQHATDGDARDHDDDRIAAAYNLLVQWDEIRRLAQARGTYTPAMKRFMDEVTRLVATSPDPTATFEEVLNVISRERAKNRPCHVYPGLCTTLDGDAGDSVDANGRHYDHGGDMHFVPGLEIPGAGDPEIWAAFTHVSAGTPYIGFMGFDLTPSQARAKAQEMRRFADEVDALADQVETAVAKATA